MGLPVRFPDTVAGVAAAAVSTKKATVINAIKTNDLEELLAIFAMKPDL